MLEKKTLLLISGVLIVVIGALFVITQGKSVPETKIETDENLSAVGGETTNPLRNTDGYSNNETEDSPKLGAEETAGGGGNNSLPTTMTDFDKTKTYTASVKTSAGDIVIALNASATPITVKNFVDLAEKKFYENVIFHRVIKGFMIQGGDPTGTGTGGPGYKFADEPFNGEYTRGTVAMANSGPNTNGSQFFIMHADTPLPKNYVIFGKVTSGIETVDKIATAPTGPGDRPTNPVKILSIEITAK